MPEGKREPKRKNPDKESCNLSDVLKIKFYDRKLFHEISNSNFEVALISNGKIEVFNDQSLFINLQHVR
jgi:hypothetical protein